MRITNKLGLPQPIVDAVTNDNYSKGHADFSVTELIGPAWQRNLAHMHAGEIEEDVSDRIWSLMGQSIHGILEKATGPEYLAESRWSIELDGTSISGQIDLYDPDRRLIQDYKTTSVWAIINGGRSDWEAQLNIYAYIARSHGAKIERLEVVAILRDWSQTKARYSDGSYPRNQVVIVPVKVWPDDVVLAYIRERLAAHLNPKPCTDAETWAKPDMWAVMKVGRKSAVRVLGNQFEAETMAAELGSGHSVQHRPGEKPRCEGYCPVSQWCEYKTIDNRSHMSDNETAQSRA